MQTGVPGLEFGAGFDLWRYAAGLPLGNHWVRLGAIRAGFHAALQDSGELVLNDQLPATPSDNASINQLTFCVLEARQGGQQIPSGES